MSSTIERLLALSEEFGGGARMIGPPWLPLGCVGCLNTSGWSANWMRKFDFTGDANEDHLKAGMIQQRRGCGAAQLGGLERMKETYRERRTFALVETTAQDLRYARGLSERVWIHDDRERCWRWRLAPILQV